MVFIERKIFNALSSKELQMDYIKNVLDNSSYDIMNEEVRNKIAETIFKVISKSEKIIKSYGPESYMLMNYPAKELLIAYQAGYGIYVYDDTTIDDVKDIDDLTYIFVLLSEYDKN